MLVSVVPTPTLTTLCPARGTLAVVTIEAVLCAGAAKRVAVHAAMLGLAAHDKT